VYTYLSESGLSEPLLWGPQSKILPPLSDCDNSHKGSLPWLVGAEPRVPGGCSDPLGQM